MRFRQALLCLALFLAALPVRAEIFVASGDGGGAVHVYADGAGTNAAPLRSLSGPATGITTPLAIAVDQSHGELYVLSYPLGINPPAIRVFPIQASGNAAPVRSIVGATTGLSGPIGIAVDPVNDEIFVADFNGGDLKVFARTANGDVAPIRTLGGANTGLTEISKVFVDLANDELFVGTGFFINSVQPRAVRVFPRTASGNVAPLRSITGTLTQLPAVNGLFVDLATDELVVAADSSVNVFARTASGNVPPLRRIAGLQTGLGRSEGLTVTATEILVTEISGPASVFPRLANGDVPPSRTFPGGRALTSTLAAGGASSFVAGAATLFLGGGRFEVEATWHTPQGFTGTGQPVALTTDTGYFWFFNSANVEVVIKVLNGCGVNSRFWVFVAGLTNVRVDLKVTDREAGVSVQYSNPLSTPFQPIQDTNAFATCP